MVYPLPRQLVATTCFITEIFGACALPIIVRRGSQAVGPIPFGGFDFQVLYQGTSIKFVMLKLGFQRLDLGSELAVSDLKILVLYLKVLVLFCRCTALLLPALVIGLKFRLVLLFQTLFLFLLGTVFLALLRQLMEDPVVL